MGDSNKCAALDAPRTTCPFSGGKLEFKETSAGWRAQGPNWIGTKCYPTRAIAEWYFSFDQGVPPSFPNPFTRVSVKSPEDAKVPEADDAVKQAAAAGEELVKIGDKAVKDT